MICRISRIRNLLFSIYSLVPRLKNNLLCFSFFKDLWHVWCILYGSSRLASHSDWLRFRRSSFPKRFPTYRIRRGEIFSHKFHCFHYNPLTPRGRIRPKKIHLGILLISPRRRRVRAGLHAADTLRHACIDFFTYLDDQGSRQSDLCPSRERRQTKTYVGLPIISSGFETVAGVRGLYNCFVDLVE